MFASYVDYSKTMLTTVNKKYTNVAAPAMVADLSFVDYATKRNTTNDEQITCAFPTFTWTNGTNEGNCKGLKEIREKVQRIFVLRRLNQWRLSELS